MVKFCQDRVQHVEKNYGLLCQSLGSVTRKIAKMRDKGQTCVVSTNLQHCTLQNYFQNISIDLCRNISKYFH